MRSITFAAAAALVLSSVPASAIEPRPISAAKQLKPDMGAVRLSVRSQAQQQGTLHLWFLRDGGDPAQKADILKFERKVGVPIAGVNMMDSKPLVYAVRPGRYRLLAHGVKCPGLPPEGTVSCSVRENHMSFQTSAARYGEDAPGFEVVAGKLTNAGDYILEAPAGSPMTEEDGVRFTWSNARLLQVRVLPSLAPVPVAFTQLGAGPTPATPDAFRSNISCNKRPKGAALYTPFTC